MSAVDFHLPPGFRALAPEWWNHHAEGNPVVGLRVQKVLRIVTVPDAPAHPFRRTDSPPLALRPIEIAHAMILSGRVKFEDGSEDHWARMRGGRLMATLEAVARLREHCKELKIRCINGAGQ